MESQRFDESFKQAFDGAELPPSDSVWTNVELELEKVSGGSMKRRLIMFQLLAAASTVFALGLGAVYYLNVEPIRPTKDVQLSEERNAEILIPDVSETTDHAGKEASSQKNDGINNTAEKERTEKHHNRNSNQWAASHTGKVSEKTAPAKYAPSGEGNAVTHDVPRVSEPGIQFRYAVKAPALAIPEKEEDKIEPDAGTLLLARLRDEEKKYQEEDKEARPQERLWTSIGMGAGMYNPNMSSSSSVLGAAATRSEPSKGTSYSFGVAVGHKISKRFIIQGGVSYLTQNADFSSGAARNGVAALTEYASISNSRDFVAASPYTVNSSLQFISMPLQAGYVLVDRAFAIQLNGGITTDLFLRNTLTPHDENYKRVSQSAGEDSPYRSVNFSGLVGTEFGYKLAQQYRVSLTPGLRYSLNSIYKSEIGTQINPIVYDVSLRIRYIFK